TLSIFPLSHPATRFGHYSTSPAIPRGWRRFSASFQDAERTLSRLLPRQVPPAPSSFPHPGFPRCVQRPAPSIGGGAADLARCLPRVVSQPGGESRRSPPESSLPRPH